ncbi:pol1p [Saccharomyces arboricola H-6]|uniref:DNA polymerase n=1 Tax=Saccharomyces arboricola (strain H-6 / AS 2.3317 / CBS 10644) TaxID=1160507 RepID=J8PXD0_SACAR|nr:pol1p [Saccharomyces arboricola H-6]
MSSKSEKLHKLRKLQAARNGTSVDDYEEDEEDGDRLYDEVDEKEYRARKRQELLHDDFVVDDDGLGYVDRGVEEDWREDGNNYIDEDDEDSGSLASKDAKRKKGLKKEKDHPITDMLRTQHSKSTLLTHAKKAQKKSMAIDDFDDILGEFESGEAEKPKVTLPAKLRANLNSSPSADFKSSVKRLNGSSNNNTSMAKRVKIDPDSSTDKYLEINSSPLKSQSRKQRYANDVQDLLDDVENSPVMANKKLIQPENILVENPPSSQSLVDGDDDDSDDDIILRKRTMRSVTATKRVNLDSRSNPSTSPFVTAPGTPIGIRAPTPTKPSRVSTDATVLTASVKKEDVIDPETDSFQMFWLDFCEVNTTLILFGKVKLRNDKYVSAMVQVNGLCRELFFLPREGKTPADVHEEIIPLLMDKYGLDNIRAKPQKMKYSFELPDIPSENDYLKVLLPYQTPKSSRDTIPSDLSSDTFHHVFGGNANIFESFVIQNKIMGPCWLEIKGADFNAVRNSSHCAIEVFVDKPQNIVPNITKTMPDLRCLSLSMQTLMNPKENKQEIISITLSSYRNISLDSPIPENIKPEDICTLVRPPQSSSFPLGLAALAKQKLPGRVRLFNNEKAMLSCFCAMLKMEDPDVMIGHRLQNVYLDVLAHRMHDLNIPTFSSIGRRLRRTWPEKFGRGNSSMNHFFISDMCSGRLICDIANEMGQSLTPKCQSWDLSEMYQVTCEKEHKALDIDYQNPQYQNDVNSMTMALQENITNCIISAEVSFRIQLLSLTKQLTNLAGNAWAQTLGGTRAGRNEYILLHEFSRNGYIVPDKEGGRNRTQRQKQNDENASAPKNSKKAKYQGGLVFEPEKGLHKNYVLVMDFNSLYPSIIQEFNICFTTVDRNKEDIDELSNVPPSEVSQGVLPRLLANLVDRRREVKKVMKTETDPHKRVQCDIRQQALKLTANSMYGCLGYVNSRFYAKPLAMLVTNKGREILMNTRQLAESMNLLVVYGDTDSVMIDTGCDNYADAIKIGLGFKKSVNERYRLLEIDIDNVFKKLLLHAKKKYAALTVSLDKNGNETTVLEVKGLDMKRREFCPLSRDVSIHVLNTILSDKDPEEALQEVYEYLEDIRTKVEANNIRIDKYKINMRLSKDPTAYPGGKNMPAVQVALRMRKAGRVVKAGSVITFVITKQGETSDDENTPAPSVAERAYALNEVMIKGNNLKPDPQYYLEKQLFAPVERLLERIDSFNVVRLTEALGLDSKKYFKREGANGNGGDANNLQPLETTVTDIERFKDTVILELICPSCDQQFPFGGIVSSNHYRMSYNGIQCKHCEQSFSFIQLSSQIEHSIRAHISLYYAGWLQCDDSTCGVVTRQLSVFGKRCLNEGCTGVMRYKYTDKQLYNQLLYFDSLFDCEKNKKQELKPLYMLDELDYPKEQLTESSIKALTEQNRELMETGRDVVQKYLNDCGRRYVDMGSIFDFMLN